MSVTVIATGFDNPNAIGMEAGKEQPAEPGFGLGNLQTPGFGSSAVQQQPLQQPQVGTASMGMESPASNQQRRGMQDIIDIPTWMRRR